MKTINALALAFATALSSSHALASDWRAALEEEKDRNANRIAAIEQEGHSVAHELRQTLRLIDVHNTGRPDPRNHAAVDAYNREAGRLNGTKSRLVGRLQALIGEQERLAARNGEIQRRLRCVQLPIGCQSNADCQCSGSCGQLGEGGPTLCQPRS